MKQYIIPAIRLTITFFVFFAVLYPCLIWGIARFSPNSGGGEIIEHNGKRYYSQIGQSFTEDRYFWSRPSAVGYDAAASGGSNMSPLDEKYLAGVQARIDAFLQQNPEVVRSEIPVDLVTAGGSGLDPDFSVQAAKVQVKRIAKVRNLNESQLLDLIDQYTEKPLFGLFGPAKINVLKLNIALDNLKSVD